MNIQAHPDLGSRLAAAYALGTLRGGARRRFETLARQSAALRAQVLLWQEHFAGMIELQPAAQPGAHVWKRIENLITAEPRPQEREALLGRLRARMAMWRVTALATGFAAVAAIVVALQLHARPEVRYVAVLADDRQAPAMLVTFDPSHATLTLKRVGTFDEGADRSLQLWALPPGQAPQSLGVIDAKGLVRLRAAEAQVRGTPAMAVSLEPKGGAPAGSGPTGPVLWKGAVVEAL